MKVFAWALFALIFIVVPAMAAPPSDEAIQELLAVSHAQKLLDGIMPQIDSLMNNSMQQSLQGKTPTPAQQQAIDKMRLKMVALVHSEVSWEKMEPMYIRIYKESFTDDEVVGIINFYKSPTGQAMINKMPVLMQSMIEQIKNMMASMTPRMQNILTDFSAEMSAASK
jgi:hypothetical protein